MNKFKRFIKHFIKKEFGRGELIYMDNKIFNTSKKNVF